MKTKNLTQSEKMLIMRLRMGMSQRHFAWTYYIGRSTYVEIERGNLSFNDYLHVKVSVENFFMWNPNIYDHEVCLIGRRRYDLTQKQMARFLGKSTNWVSLMELGEVDCTDYVERILSEY